MYGCIVGKDTEGIWLIAEGLRTDMVDYLDTIKRLASDMDVRVVDIEKSELDTIRDNSIELLNRFSGIYESLSD